MYAAQVSWLRSVAVRIIGGFLSACIALLFAFPGVLSAASSDSLLTAAPPLPPIPPPEVEVSNEPFDQFSPKIAYNWKQDEYLVVWRNAPSSGNHSIWARRIAITGEPRGPVFEIAAAAPSNLANPSVAYDPVHERYLVVWSELSVMGDWDIFGRFVPWEGPQPALAPFPIMPWLTNQYATGVAYGRGPEEFLIVWANEQLPFWTVNGVRISAATGATVAAPLTIAHPSEHRRDPAIAYNAARNEYLIVYDNDQDVFAQRFDASGNALGAELIPAGWPSTEYAPSVAACSEADQFLVTWMSNEGVNGTHGYVRYIEGNGQFPGGGGPFRVDSRANTSYAPAVSCGVVGPNTTGGHYLVTWEAQFGFSPLGIWGRFFGDDFSSGPLFGVLSKEDTLDRMAPAVVGGEGGFLVAGMEATDHSGALRFNVRARLISPYALALPHIQR